eukprot:scaffold4866_cov152-Isochrysis_galbana.AAC.2
MATVAYSFRSSVFSISVPLAPVGSPTFRRQCAMMRIRSSVVYGTPLPSPEARAASVRSIELSGARGGRCRRWRGAWA